MLELHSLFDSEKDLLNEFRREDINVETKAHYTLYLVKMAYANGYNQFRGYAFDKLAEMLDQPKKRMPSFKLIKEGGK